MIAHRLLKRQARKYLGTETEIPAELHGFLKAVETAYHQFDKDRQLTDRATRLSSVELRNAIDAADRANEAKNEFLANMSHEFRTPINAIVGMTDLLLDHPLGVEERDLAGIIRTSSNALIEILNDILDYSKIESGKLEIVHQPFDVVECLEQVSDFFAVPCAEKGIELSVFIGRGVPELVCGDVMRLRQILINVVGNAVKFTESGSITVSVSADYEDEGRHLCFDIEDTGIGIPKERIDRLFKSFSQVDSSMNRRFGGTGLGLAISKRLAELMGGTMTVESTEGKGSIFSFSVVVGVESAEGFVSPMLGKRLILFEKGMNKISTLDRQLRDWGVFVATAFEGSDVLQNLASIGACDGVLVDVSRLNGAPEDVIKSVLAVTKSRNIPVVFVGHRGSSSIEVRQQDAGWVNKPVKARELHATLDQFVNKPAMDAASAAPVKRRFDREFATSHPLRILVADDNAINRKLVLTMLQRLGYPAQSVEDGSQALERVREERFDLIFMDVQMPVIDGLEATRQIMATIPEAERPIVIAHTANARKEDEELCFESGMNGFIAKPLRVDELLEALSGTYRTVSGRE